MRINSIRTTVVPENKMNEQLSSLYNANWNNCLKIIRTFQEKGYELAHPYLLTASDEYCNADTKVVCLGKETQGWGGEFADQPTIKELQQLYTLYIYKEQGNRAAFHNFVNWISSLSEDVSVIPSNIIKVGKKSIKGYYKPVVEEMQMAAPMLKEELSILAPSVIICPTSNLYDYNQPLSDMLGNHTEQVLLEEPFVSERRYDSFPDIPFIICPHPQGKPKEELDKIKQIVSKYILG